MVGWVVGRPKGVWYGGKMVGWVVGLLVVGWLVC